MMTMNKAKSLALDCVARLTGRARDELLIIDELTQCRRCGWIFFYESRAYLETGDVSHGIGTKGPVVVTHQGETHPLAGERPAEDALRDFELRSRRRGMLP
jgi:hypothetical protein